MKASPTPTKRHTRFWNLVNKDGPVPAHAPHLGACWVWAGSLDRGGYGLCGRTPGRVGMECLAHRAAYVELVGRIPKRRPHLDHLCRVRSCVNPAHLEPVTPKENTRRGCAGDAQRARTHCPQGHAYIDVNTYVSPRGDRQCRTCMRARSLAWKRRAA